MTDRTFTHLRVELDGLTFAGRVWSHGDIVPLDGSTPDPVGKAILDNVELGHPHLTAGTLTEGGEFVPYVPVGDVEEVSLDEHPEKQQATKPKKQKEAE